MEKDELLHPLGFDRCTSGIRTRAGPTELPGNCDTGRVRCKVRQHRREKRAGTDQTRAPVHGKPNSGREQNIHYRTQWTSYHGRKVVALTLGLMAKWANSRTSGSSEMRKKTCWLREEDAVEEDARSCSGSVDSARRKTRPRGLHPRAQYSERRQGTVARRRPFSGELGD
jgi:hypothetical protein